MKRHLIETSLTIGRIRRFIWFWRYIILRKPLRIKLSLMGKNVMFIESVGLQFFNIDFGGEDNSVKRNVE